MGVFQNLTGQRFGRLKVIELVGINKRRYAIWKCLCDCGTYTTTDGGKLREGNTNSCGCLRRELSAQQMQALNTTHGHTSRYKTSPEYNSWRCMTQRCYNPNHASYERYGAKGVRVCDRWRDFENFLADIGPRPTGTTLGRTLDLGNYEPGNVFWMTKAEQMLSRMNKRNLLKWAAERGREWIPEQIAA